MNTIKTICLFILSIISITLSQDIQIQWSKTYDYDYDITFDNSIDFAHDGGYIFTTGRKMFKIDGQGTVQEDWPLDPLPDNQSINYLQKCNKGYITTGYICLESENKIKAFLRKIDNQGRQEWEKLFFNSDTDYADISDYGMLVKQTHDNGYILIFDDFQMDWTTYEPDNDYWIIKTDQYGEIQWDYWIWGDYNSGEPSAIYQTSDNGYIIAYNYDSGNLLRLTADGHKMWEKKYENNIGHVLPTENGGFLICGYNYIKMVDKYGDEIWINSFQNDHAYSLTYIKRPDNNSYLLSGSIIDSSNRSKGWLIKTDNFGNKIWGKTLTDITNIYQILKISQNEYILFGYKGGYTTIIKIKEDSQQTPTTFELLDPVDNKLGVGTQLCLDWTSVANVSSYLLEVDDDNDMSSPLVSKTISNESNCIVDGLSDSTYYYWRVKALFSDNSGSWSEISTFKTMQPPHMKFNGPDGYNLSYVDVGDQYYTDRDYTITSLPDPFKNCLWIKTQNSDKFNTYDDFIHFYLETDAIVYVAYDNRASSVPHWLLSHFERTQYTIENTDEYCNFTIWKGQFAAGEVTLGANIANGAEGVLTNYVVFIDIPLQLLDPRDNKTGVGIDLSLSWEALSNLENYDLQINDNQDMSSPLYNINDIWKPWYCLKDLDYNKDYYWRIKAHNRNDEDAWSQTQKFHTMNEPPIHITYWIDYYYLVESLSWLEENDQYYFDRNYIIHSIPDPLKNLLWIKTANDNAQKDSDIYLNFGSQSEITLYVGFDSRATSLPNWVTDDFSNTGLTIKVSDAAKELNIWSRTVKKGWFYLESNIGEGAENIKSHYVVLIDTNQVQPLSAHFGSDVTSGVLPLTVNFADSSQGLITSWLWDFGDGATSTEKNPSHTYENAGSYTVSLTVSGLGGSDTITKENYITVKNVIANFGADVTMGQAPLTVSFTDSSLGDIDAWLWKFGDGLTSTSQNPTHVYTSGDSFTVSLFVRNSSGSNTMVKTNYIIVDHPTSIDDMAWIPEKFDLLPNYPNPFNPQTTIRFAVPQKSFVNITIFDINGKLVQNLFSGTKNPGNYAITWNAAGFSSGMYFIKMDTDAYSSVRKCILVK